MSKRFLHISDGWNNWWRYTRRTTLKKCNYKVDVIINYLYRLVYWSWHKMSLPTTGFLELTLVPRTLAGFFFIEINLSVTNTDRFTEAVFIKLQLPTLIVLDDYTLCLPYLCSPVYRIECFSRFISCHYKFNL